MNIIGCKISHRYQEYSTVHAVRVFLHPIRFNQMYVAGTYMIFVWGAGGCIMQTVWLGPNYAN